MIFCEKLNFLFAYQQAKLHVSTRDHWVLLEHRSEPHANVWSTIAETNLVLEERLRESSLTVVNYLLLCLHFRCPYYMQGCALAEPSGPWRMAWHLTFALGRLENLRFFIQIICWAP